MILKVTIACIYDMDNTFALTSRADAIALSATFNEFAPDLANHSSIDYDRDIRGKDIGVVCETINKNLGLQLDQGVVRKRFRELFKQQLEFVVFTNGTHDAVQALHKQGIVQAIASNSSHVRLNHVLGQLATLTSGFNLSTAINGGVFSALDQTPDKIKPEPDIFVLAAENIIAQHSNSGFTIYMIEESSTGMKAAVAARKMLMERYGQGLRVEVIGYTGDRVMLSQCPNKATNELLTLGADRCFEDMIDFSDHVLSASQQGKHPRRSPVANRHGPGIGADL